MSPVSRSAPGTLAVTTSGQRTTRCAVPRVRSCRGPIPSTPIRERCAARGSLRKDRLRRRTAERRSAQSENARLSTLRRFGRRGQWPQSDDQQRKLTTSREIRCAAHVSSLQDYKGLPELVRYVAAPAAGSLHEQHSIRRAESPHRGHLTRRQRLPATPTTKRTCSKP